MTSARGLLDSSAHHANKIKGFIILCIVCGRVDQRATRALDLLPGREAPPLWYVELRAGADLARASDPFSVYMYLGHARAHDNTCHIPCLISSAHQATRIRNYILCIWVIYMRAYLDKGHTRARDN